MRSIFFSCALAISITLIVGCGGGGGGGSDISAPVIGPVFRPDLRIDTIVSSPVTPTAGNAFQLTVTVVNGDLTTSTATSPATTITMKKKIGRAHV